MANVKVRIIRNYLNDVVVLLVLEGKIKAMLRTHITSVAESFAHRWSQTFGVPLEESDYATEDEYYQLQAMKYVRL